MGLGLYMIRFGDGGVPLDRVWEGSCRNSYLAGQGNSAL